MLRAWEGHNKGVTVWTYANPDNSGMAAVAKDGNVALVTVEVGDYIAYLIPNYGVTAKSLALLKTEDFTDFAEHWPPGQNFALAIPAGLYRGYYAPGRG